MVNALLVGARGIHYASALLLFGELIFQLAVARPSWRRGAAEPNAADAALDRRLARRCAGWLALSIVSGAAWLALEASVMSGLPLAQALDRAIVGRVVTETIFGRVWIVRAVLAVAIGALLLTLRRTSPASARSLWIAMLADVTAYVALLAPVGHAAVELPDNVGAAIATDVVHLLAAGAWVGALPAFVIGLGLARSPALAAPLTRRYSLLGAVCVALLAASGLVSATYLVGDIPALFGTAYGRLLVAKLALLAAMLALAMANRWYLSIRLPAGDSRALRALRRNAAAEFLIGLGVVALVGALGVTTPATHETPLWPFARTLGFGRLEQSAGLQMVVAAVGTIGLFAAGAMLAGVRGRQPLLGLAGAAGFTASVALIVSILAEPAYPTTYALSPVGYTVDAITRGGELYAAQCTECHGREGRGDGPASRSLPVRPPDLAEHASKQREGDLYWRIAHGVAGSPMRGFSPPLAATDVWQIVQFLYATSEARFAQRMSNRLQPLRPIVAPDFTFEVEGRAQESLRQLRTKSIVLLVLYTLPQSSARLADLGANVAAYTRAGARVIALPIAPSAAVDGAASSGLGLIAARASAGVAPVYLRFAGSADAAGALGHVEFLIDRQGELRMRWLGFPDAVAVRGTETLDGIETLFPELPRNAPVLGHGHR